MSQQQQISTTTAANSNQSRLPDLSNEPNFICNEDDLDEEEKQELGEVEDRANQYYESIGFQDNNDYRPTRMDLGNLIPYMKSKQNAYNILAIEGKKLLL